MLHVVTQIWREENALFLHPNILSFALELEELLALTEKDWKVWLRIYRKMFFFIHLAFLFFSALSYISILQGENLRWTLFVHCWRAKTPDNPDSVEIATSFNVFSLDRELCSDDRRRIIKELKKRGFNTRPENIIEFDYSTTDCS